MKKLFVLFSLTLIVFAANSQTVNLAMAQDNYIISTVDYTITNTTVLTFIYDARGMDWTNTQDFLFQLDSVSGNHTNVAVALYGAKFATGAYSAIGSAVNWKGTTADTTIIISNATATRWNYFKITMTGTGTGVSKLDAQEVKLYNE